MNNIFKIGGQVTDRSFIGRKGLLDKFKKWYLSDMDKVCKSIVGLTRIGKSSFISKVFEEIPEDILYINIDLKEISTYQELWYDIANSVMQYVKYHNIINSELFESIELLEDENISWMKLRKLVKNIFREVKSVNKRTIIVIDEFDYATNLFNNETKYYELLRTIFSGADYNVSSILISRRSLYLIEGTTYQSSTFHGIFECFPFPGFDDDDMVEFYNFFIENNIQLAKNDKKDIEYYSGRSPFLLSILGHYIVDEYLQKGTISISSIFMNKCKSINDYYRDCLKHLERDNDLTRIIPFIIGPNIGVTNNDKYELISLGYLRENNCKLIAISEYFHLFLSSTMVNFSIWDNLINVEKKLKTLIAYHKNEISKQLALSGNVFSDKSFLLKISGISQSDVDRYDSYIRHNFNFFNKVSNYLDVISLTDVIRIISQFWGTIFDCYFGQVPLTQWKFKFDSCAKARNPIAHGHEDYLSDSQRIEIDSYCKQILDNLARNNFVDAKLPDDFNEDTVITTNQILNEFSDKPKANSSILTVGDRVTVTIESISSNKSVKARINHSIIAVVSKKSIKSKRINHDSIGVCYSAKVNSYNAGQSLYVVDLI